MIEAFQPVEAPIRKQYLLDQKARLEKRLGKERDSTVINELKGKLKVVIFQIRAYERRY